MLSLTPHNFILFELYFDVKFPLLRLLHSLSDLKSTIVKKELSVYRYRKGIEYNKTKNQLMI